MEKTLKAAQGLFLAYRSDGSLGIRMVFAPNISFLVRTIDFDFGRHPNGGRTVRIVPTFSPAF